MLMIFSGRPLVQAHIPQPLVLALTISAVLAVTGCATRPKVPAPLRSPVTVAAPAETAAASDGSVVDPAGRVVLSAPASLEPDPGLSGTVKVPDVLFSRDAQPVSLVLDGVPLTTFIDVVFGNELKLPITIDAGVRTRGDLVSLRMAQPQTHPSLYRTAVEVLRNYNVVVADSGGVLRFSMAQGTLGTNSPLYVDQ